MNKEENKLDLLKKVITLCQNNASGKIQENDHFAHFIYFFFNKMLSHAESFFLLYSIKSSDVLLITRTMIEGYSLLKYTLDDTISIPLKWRNYMLIDAYASYSLIAKKVGKDNPDIEKNLIQKIEENCTEFLTDKKNGRMINGKRYVNTWYNPLSISSIVNKYTHDMVRVSYSENSFWHHWSPFTQNSINQYGKESISFELHMGYNDSYIIAMYCLMNTAQIYLNYKNEISEIEKLQTYYSEYSKIEMADA